MRGKSSKAELANKQIIKKNNNNHAYLLGNFFCLFFLRAFLSIFSPVVVQVCEDGGKQQSVVVWEAECKQRVRVCKPQRWLCWNSPSCFMGAALIAEHSNAVKTNQGCLQQGQREGSYVTACLKSRQKSSMATCRDLSFFHLFSRAAPGIDVLSIPWGREDLSSSFSPSCSSFLSLIHPHELGE